MIFIEKLLTEKDDEISKHKSEKRLILESSKSIKKELDKQKIKFDKMISHYESKLKIKTQENRELTQMLQKVNDDINKK